MHAHEVKTTSEWRETCLCLTCPHPVPCCRGAALLRASGCTKESPSMRSITCVGGEGGGAQAKSILGSRFGGMRAPLLAAVPALLLACREDNDTLCSHPATLCHRSHIDVDAPSQDPAQMAGEAGPRHKIVYQNELCRGRGFEGVQKGKGCAVRMRGLIAGHGRMREGCTITCGELSGAGPHTQRSTHPPMPRIAWGPQRAGSTGARSPGHRA